MKVFNQNGVISLNKMIFSIIIAALFILGMILTKDLFVYKLSIVIVNLVIFTFVGYAIYDAFLQYLSFNDKRGLLIYFFASFLILIVYFFDADAKSYAFFDLLLGGVYYSLIGGSFFYLLAKLIKKLQGKKEK